MVEVVLHGAPPSVTPEVLKRFEQWSRTAAS
jgi:hypothetical protein